MRWLAAQLMRFKGWEFTGEKPDTDKFVVVAAPHTSNWDFLLFLAMVHNFGIKARVIGKHTLVRWPFGGLMRRLGVIPVRRDTGQGLVEQVVAAFAADSSIALTIAPEGTRRPAPYWRSGFYHIARAAGVPLLLGFIDGDRKVAGLGPAIVPTGDIAADMEVIRDFYSTIRGINPEHQGPVRLNPGTGSQPGI